MSARTWRLDRVRSVREAEERLARSEWSELQARAQAALARCAEADEQMRRGLEGLEAAQGSARGSVAEVLLFQRCLDVLESRRRQLTQVASRASALAEQARDRWQGTKRAVKSLQRLEQRFRHSQAQARLRSEALSMDGVAQDRSAANLAARAEESSPYSSAEAPADVWKPSAAPLDGRSDPTLIPDRP